MLIFYPNTQSSTYHETTDKKQFVVFVQQSHFFNKTVYNTKAIVQFNSHFPCDSNVLKHLKMGISKQKLIAIFKSIKFPLEPKHSIAATRYGWGVKTSTTTKIIKTVSFLNRIITKAFVHITSDKVVSMNINHQYFQ
jgi:hypothetical protein